jgi:antitoxin (DNA-binding transcriptional repressor) of toxin-antitoxin stability system
MTIQIDVAQLGPALVEDLSQNGGEILLTRDGKPIAKLVWVEGATDVQAASAEERVLYNGRWMVPAAAERERSIEHLRGSGKILGDIVNANRNGPLAGTILYEGDIVSPLDEEWEADK